MSDGIHVLEQWLPTTPKFTSKPGERSAAAYDQVLDQFEVETNPRYAATAKDTFCSTFFWDVTRAMGAEVPHWVDRETHEPAAVSTRNEELNINHQLAWLREYGAAHGWSTCDSAVAKARAAEGHPVAVIYENPTGHGHVAMLRPNGNCIQAGAKNHRNATLGQCFGNFPVSFWTAP